MQASAIFQSRLARGDSSLQGVGKVIARACRYFLLQIVLVKHPPENREKSIIIQPSKKNICLEIIVLNGYSTNGFFMLEHLYQDEVTDKMHI